MRWRGNGRGSNGRWFLAFRGRRRLAVATLAAVADFGESSGGKCTVCYRRAANADEAELMPLKNPFQRFQPFRVRLEAFQRGKVGN